MHAHICSVNKINGCLYTYKSEKCDLRAFRALYFDFICAGNINYHPKKKSRLKRLKIILFLVLKQRFIKLIAQMFQNVK